jgi:hypothetical protein
MSGSPLDVAVGATSRIGRYFAIVSVLPSALLVLLVLFVNGSVVDGSSLDLSEGGRRLSELGLEGAVWVTVVSILLSLLLHPVQFALTQFMEGYWGASRIGVAMAAYRIRVHRRRAHCLSDVAADAQENWTWKAYRSLPAAERARHRGPSKQAHRIELAELRMDQSATDFLVSSYVRAQASDKALDDYPVNGRRVMPTRLGNILRRNEDLIGSGYGLDLVTVAPYLATVADPAHHRDVQSEGEQMDLSIRMCLVLLIGATASALLLAPTGWGALLSLIPYAGSYLAYRAACVSAAGYMSALSVVMHLNRFALYRALGLGVPKNSAHEALLAETASLIISDRRGEWTFVHET